MPDSARLRTATSADLAAICRINEAAVPAVGSVPASRMAWFLEQALAFPVVEVDGEVAGFVLALPPGLPYASENYAWFSARYDDFCYIDRLAIDVGHRRLGFARRLYEAVTGRAVEAGHPRIACEVNLRPHNAESLAFHAAMGFHEVGQQETEGGSKRVSMLVRELADG